MPARGAGVIPHRKGGSVNGVVLCVLISMSNGIKSSISVETAKKILANRDNALLFLMSVHVKPPSAASASDVFGLVVKHWDFEKGTRIIRDLFTRTEKYKNGKSADGAMELLLGEWKSVCAGKIAWPFSQGDFDGFVQRLNSEQTEGFEKDEKVKEAAVKYRRIKEINTLRNDFIEMLIFEKNLNVIPTLSHRRGVDFFIDGEQYDQKVGSSPTRQFISDFGGGKDTVNKKLTLHNADSIGDFKNRDSAWKQTAINNPNLVAKYLYTYQDEGRFGAGPRLLVVYLDEDVSAGRIKELIEKNGFSKSFGG